MPDAPRLELAVVIINYRGGAMTIDCLESLEPELAPHDGRRRAIVVDNDSPDDSAAQIRAAIAERGWSDWAAVVDSPCNGGFSYGNNVGLHAADAATYLLLNSDTLVRPGAIDHLLATLATHPEVGAVGPRLEWPDGRYQVSTFRVRTPWSELITEAATGPITRMLRRFDTPMPLHEPSEAPHWMSFACILIRREVIEAIGELDVDYFMYFEDIDYCRRLRAAGWSLRYEPDARVVHLRGGTSSVKADAARGARLPRYFYASRSRYFATWCGGRVGLAAANLGWMLGRSVARVRARLGRPTRTVDHAALDIWTNWRRPDQPWDPSRPSPRPVRPVAPPATPEDSTMPSHDAAPNAGEVLMRPHFMIIGAMKCATSTLHDQLGGQPGVFMSTPKEPNFFSDDDAWRLGVDWYRDLFAGAGAGHVCGESSTHYTKLPTYPETVDRIRRHAPNARFIYVIRHPVQRLVSHYIHEWTERTIECPIDEAVRRYPRLIAYSQYAMQLQPFLDAFGPDRLQVVFFERLITSPQSELERVWRFIGAEGTPSWRDDLEASNVSGQRLRRSPLRDLVVNAPGVRTIRRRFIPQSWRDHVKQWWTMRERPSLGPEVRPQVESELDEDLAVLGRWLDLDLTCANFSAVAADTAPTWSASLQQELAA